MSSQSSGPGRAVAAGCRPFAFANKAKGILLVTLGQSLANPLLCTRSLSAEYHPVPVSRPVADCPCQPAGCVARKHSCALCSHPDHRSSHSAYSS
jgi:hypothetical protein